MIADSPADAPVARPRGDALLLVYVLAWIVVYFVARMVLERTGMSDVTRLAIALAPLLPFLLFLRGFVRGLRDADELERRIQLEALAVAFPITVIMLMVLSLVELAFPLSRDDWSYRHVWSFLPLFYFGGLTLARRRYR